MSPGLEVAFVRGFIGIVALDKKMTTVTSFTSRRGESYFDGASSAIGCYRIQGWGVGGREGKDSSRRIIKHLD